MASRARLQAADIPIGGVNTYAKRSVPPKEKPVVVHTEARRGARMFVDDDAPEEIDFSRSFTPSDILRRANLPDAALSSERPSTASGRAAVSGKGKTMANPAKRALLRATGSHSGGFDASVRVKLRDCRPEDLHEESASEDSDGFVVDGSEVEMLTDADHTEDEEESSRAKPMRIDNLKIPPIGRESLDGSHTQSNKQIVDSVQKLMHELKRQAAVGARDAKDSHEVDPPTSSAPAGSARASSNPLQIHAGAKDAEPAESFWKAADPAADLTMICTKCTELSAVGHTENILGGIPTMVLTELLRSANYIKDAMIREQTPGEKKKLVLTGLPLGVVKDMYNNHYKAMMQIKFDIIHPLYGDDATGIFYNILSTTYQNLHMQKQIHLAENPAKLNFYFRVELGAIVELVVTAAKYIYTKLVGAANAGGDDVSLDSHHNTLIKTDMNYSMHYRLLDLVYVAPPNIATKTQEAGGETKEEGVQDLDTGKGSMDDMKLSARLKRLGSNDAATRDMYESILSRFAELEGAYIVRDVHVPNPAIIGFLAETISEYTIFNDHSYLFNFVSNVQRAHILAKVANYSSIISRSITGTSNYRNTQSVQQEQNTLQLLKRKLVTEVSKFRNECGMHRVRDM